jgi:hypothetical protein
MRPLLKYSDFINVKRTCVQYIEIHGNSMSLGERDRATLENQLATLCNLLYVALRHCSVKGFPEHMGVTVREILTQAEKAVRTDWFAHVQIVASYNHFMAEFGSRLPKAE